MKWQPESGTSRRVRSRTSRTPTRSTWRKSVKRYLKCLVGILVHGNNHFIVRGPLPDRASALALVKDWSLIQIGATTPPSLQQWTIRTREFGENVEWAVVVRGDGEVAPAVTQLLDELSARGITIHNSGFDR